MEWGWHYTSSSCAYRDIKYKYIQSIAVHRHILCLQETHGSSDADIESTLGMVLPNWKVLASAFVDPDSGRFVSGRGGVAICISPFLLQFCSIDFSILVPGRCLAATLRAGTQFCDIINLHNFRLSARSAHSIKAHLERSRLRGTNDPLNHFSLCLGDINLVAPGERRFKAGEYIHNEFGVARPPRGICIRVFLILSSRTGLNFPSRFPPDLTHVPLRALGLTADGALLLLPGF